jgi:hypothetical protein
MREALLDFDLKSAHERAMRLVPKWTTNAAKSGNNAATA